MRQLFENIKQSIYGPAYYQELLTRPFSFSWKYYSAFAFTLALFLTIVSSVPLVPRINQFVRDLPAKFFAYYPDNLEVRIDKGIVSSNMSEPYFLPIPEALKSPTPLAGEGESLVVIDTKAPFSLEQFEAYKADIWLGGNQIALYDRNGSIRIETFDTKTDIVVNENTLRGFEQKLQPFYKFVAPAVVLMIFVGLLIALGVNFVYLLFGAILIFFLGRLLKQRFTYGISYRIGLHATTLPLLCSVLLSLLNVPSFNFPLLYSAIMLAVVFVNFKDATPTSAPLQPPAS